MAGDRIIKINGESAIGMTNTEVPKKLKGRKGSSVDITVLREGIDEPLEFTIIRDDIPIFTVNAVFMTPDSTGYIFLSRFAKTTEDEFEKALAIDLKVWGDQHPKVAVYFSNLGSAWDALGDSKKAIEYYDRALGIFMAVYGHDHPDTKAVKSIIESMLEY